MSEINRAIGSITHREEDSFPKGKNHLFAVGINNYEDKKIPKLVNACRDINDVAKLLKEEYAFDDQVMLLDEDATRSNIINKLNELHSKIAPEDKLLIYYSGHGKVDENDDTRGYWIPVDGDLNDKSSFVTNADVTDIIKSIDARHILLISDSCFSASLLQKFRSVDEEGAYDHMEKAKSRWAFVSGKGVVSDGDDGENSPFATGILKQLNKNQDKINISLLADQVIKQVSNLYDQDAIAIPLRTKEHEEGGQFVFEKKLTEGKEWQYALQDDTEGAYIAFYNKYPTGKYAPEAKQKLKDFALAKEAEEDEKEWKKALTKNSAIYYLQYLENNPNAKHKEEARTSLERIKEDDRIEKEEERKKEQEKSFKLEKEKKELEEQARLNKIEEEKRRKNPVVPQPVIPKKIYEEPKPKPIVFNDKQPGFFKKYIFIIAFVGLIVIPGSIFWYLKTVKNSSQDEVTQARISTPNFVSESVFDGNVIGGVSQNALSGIVLTNYRTKQSTTTDTSGHFVIENFLVGDTILIAESANYFSKLLIVDNVNHYIYIGLEQKPRITENKTISGTVSGSIIEGVWVYVKRNGKIIKPYDHADIKGKFELKGVNEGDILWFDTGKGKFSKKVTQENIYDFNGSVIEAHIN